MFLQPQSMVREQQNVRHLFDFNCIKYYDACNTLVMPKDFLKIG